MNTDSIDKAFESLITQRGIHTRLGISSGKVRQYRFNLKHGVSISIDLKLKLLQQSGWRQGQAIYTLEDLVSLLNFNKKTSQAARDQGSEYVIEKWEASK